MQFLDEYKEKVDDDDLDFFATVIRDNPDNLPEEELNLIKQFLIFRRGAQDHNLDPDSYAPMLPCLDDFSLDGRTLTFRQRRWVEIMASDPTMSPALAASKAGYADGSTKNRFVHFMRQPIVLKALHTAYKYQNERFGVDSDAIWRMYVDRTMADITDIATWDENGKVKLKKSGELNRRGRKAIKSISQTHSNNGTTTKIELWDPYPYQRDLAKMMKLVEEKLIIDNAGDIAGEIEASRQRVIDAAKVQRSIPTTTYEVIE